MSVNRPCYVTREQVMRASDLNYTAYKSDAVDRAIESASESVEILCHRVFYNTDATRSFDWPNFQYAYPWRLWLDQNELAAPATAIISGPYLAAPVSIPIASVIHHPVNTGPPYTSIQLRRDKNVFFGNNTTPQNDIQITGTFGYWARTKTAGTLAVAMSDSTGTIAQLSNSTLAGVGDILIIDSERMLVQDKQMITTGVTWSGLSSSPPSAADNVVAVASGAAFTVGETLLADFERLWVADIIGNNLIVRRGYDGTVLATHSGGTLFAARQLTVTRGASGTTAAAHTINTQAFTSLVPGLVRDLALAEAEIQMTQEPSAYAYTVATSSRGENIVGGTGHGQQREPVPGPGLPDLRERCYSQHGRKARSRVI